MWHWRFAPRASGSWRWRLSAKVHWQHTVLETATPWQTVVVGQERADAMPPIRVSTRDPQWFETLDGAPYYPIGVTLRSPGDTRQVSLTAQLARPAAAGDLNDINRPLAIADQQEERAWERMGTRAYERWFARMKANGMNWARVWMCSWWCGLEWTRAWDGFGGLTSYNQANAACLDRVAGAGAQEPHLCPDRADEPRCGRPERRCRMGQQSLQRRQRRHVRQRPKFFSSDAAFAATCAKRYRYTLARWGWMSQIAAWVLSSEGAWTAAWGAETNNNEDGGRSPSTEKWVRASLDWFKANDAWARPVSVHFSHPWNGTTLWAMDGLGFNNSNAYTGFQDMNWGPPRLGGDGSGQRDLALALDLYLEQCLPPWRYHRPTIIGEWGGHWEHNDTYVLAQELHTGLWMQAVLPYAGNTGFWWWLWLDADNRWDEFKRMANFVAGDDRRGYRWQVERPRVLGGQSDVSAMGMVSRTQIRLYAWLTHLDQQPGLTSKGPAGHVHLMSGNADSAWRCERWSCTTGTLQATSTITADHDGAIDLDLGDIAPDAAFRLSAIAAR